MRDQSMGATQARKLYESTLKSRRSVESSGCASAIMRMTKETPSMKYSVMLKTFQNERYRMPTLLSLDISSAIKESVRR